MSGWFFRPHPPRLLGQVRSLGGLVVAIAFGLPADGPPKVSREGVRVDGGLSKHLQHGLDLRAFLHHATCVGRAVDLSLIHI